MKQANWTRKLRYPRIMRRARYELAQWTNPRGNRAEFHCLPLDDLKPHIESDKCWCEPKVEGSSTKSRSARLIIHNSADGRELPVM